MIDSNSYNYKLANSPSQTDIELFHALKAGESSALGILYDRYGKLVYGLSLRVLKNSQEAEDLTQEIFLNLWHKGNYNPARGSLSSYLTILTRSRAIDKIRLRGTNFKFLERWGQTMSTQTSVHTPFEQAALKERSQCVQNALVQLPQHYRQVLEMAYYEGLSQSEIAKQLNIPLGTVKTWVRQALLKLKQPLQNLIN